MTSTYTVTIHFDVKANSQQHAVLVVEKWLKEKGVSKAGEEELTLERKEPRFGYNELIAVAN